MDVRGCFSPVEMQQTAAERKIQWVLPDGTPTPGLEEMLNVNVLSSRPKTKQINWIHYGFQSLK